MKALLDSDGLYIEFPFTDAQFVVDLNGFAQQNQTSPTRVSIRFYPSDNPEERDSMLKLAHQLRAALDTAIMRHTYTQEEAK